MDFHQVLKMINKNTVDLLAPIIIKSNWKIINKAIFSDWIPDNIVNHKRNLLSRNKTKRNNLLKFKETDFSIFSKCQTNILKKEIDYAIIKLNFIEEVYDIEANKFDSNYLIDKKSIKYDFYNRKLYRVTSKDLNRNVVIKRNINQLESITKEQLIELLKYAKTLHNWIKYRFWKYINLSHTSWILRIPNKETYDIKMVITIFFHELTHFFRYINSYNNLWFIYSFRWYLLLDEGIALYNEYYYWNKITNLWKFNSYYDKCYKILLTNSSVKKKKDLIYDILSNKGFTRDKADDYYYRLYRYSILWSKNFFLKDLSYAKWYKIVKDLIKKDKSYYPKIMSWRIWLDQINTWIIKPEKNVAAKYIFKKLQRKITLLIKLK